MTTDTQTVSEAQTEPQAADPIVTAETYIADALTAAQKCLDRIVEPAKDVNHVALAQYLGYYPAVVFLEALRRRDPAEADKLAAFVHETLEAGDTAGELVWQWNRQVRHSHHMTMLGFGGDEPAVPSDVTTVAHTMLDETVVDTPSVPTTCPGLIVTQRITGRDGDYRLVPGSWHLTHASTMRLVSANSYPLDIAQALAHQLGQVENVDWTLGSDDFATSLDDTARAAIAAVFRKFEVCEYCSDADHLPVLPFRAEVPA